MPLPFPTPEPSLEPAEYPRPATLTGALRPGGTQTRAQDERANPDNSVFPAAGRTAYAALPDWEDRERADPTSWAYAYHTDPQATRGDPAAAVIDRDTKDTGPQPTEPPTLPSHGSVMPVEQTE